METRDAAASEDELSPRMHDGLMFPRYIDLAAQGRNGWWRYVVGTVVIVFFWLAAAIVAEAILESLSKGGAVKITATLESYLLLNLGHVGMVCGLFLTVRVIHKRPFLTLITPYRHFDGKRMAKGFGIWFALCAAAGIVDYLLHPTTYRYVLNPGKFFVFAPLILILTPIQACAEELLFRGYLIQGAARWTRNIGFLAVLSGLLFMAPHLWNPEVASAQTYSVPAIGFILLCAYYFGVGFLLALITMKSNSLEIAMGIHTAACLFSALIANYAHSVMETESIFFCTELAPDFNLIGFILMAAVAYWVLVWRPAERTRERVGP
jgi:uncharacterized protein